MKVEEIVMEVMEKDNWSGSDIFEEWIVLVYQKWYMNGNWRGEDIEEQRIPRKQDIEQTGRNLDIIT